MATIIAYTDTGADTYTPPDGVTTVKVLVVAGGGGGGGIYGGGGGGAGGVVFDDDYSVTPGVPINLSVGAGATGASGLAGGNSTFGTITALGGGAGGAGNNPGKNGGSGGGGGGHNTVKPGGSATQPGSASGGYGNNGGDGYGLSAPPTDRNGGGGGGAGAVGTAATSLQGGNGGAGYDMSALFADYGVGGWFGGGGGGGNRGLGTAGAGGQGGGAAGGAGLGVDAGNGVANTGGGGGGRGQSSGGGNGGSGVVLVYEPDPPLPGPASLRDMVLETTIEVINNDGHAYEIAKQLQVIGDIVTQNDGTAEIELRSPIDSVLAAQIVNTHPAAPATVEYDAETVITVIADVLLNSGKWLYKRFHYNDIAELHARFAGVWEAVTLTTADLNGLTVGDILNLLGPCLGLCISQSGDGCIDIWHPGVYRGSRRTHYFSSSDCEPGGCQIVDRGRDGQYGGVQIEGASAAIFSLVEIPVEDGWRENLYEQEVPDDLFAANQKALSAQALARQLIQRLCEPYYDITLSMGLKGMQVDLGDTIVLESDALAATIPCLVTGVSTDIETGRTEINAVHYPNSLGLHSVWENDGVRGIWRWLDSDLDADYSNMAHTALDADWTEIVSPAANRLSGHWQGSCSRMAAYNSSLLSATAEVSDLFDFGMILSGTSAGELRSPHGPTVSWADPNVGPLLAWVNADDSAMVLFWSVPGGGTGAESMLNNRLALGYTTDYTAGTIAWEWVYYLPFGSIGRTWQGTANGTRTAAAIALEWKDDTIRVYSERRLMLEVTETEADKADFTAATLYYNHASDDCYIGCFRHIRQSGWVEERQRIQGANGIDPYYGPDTL